MKPVGLGLIGCGGFGSFCLDAYASMPDLRIAAVADVIEARRDEAARRYGARPCSAASELFAAPDVDLIVISSPPDTHGPLCLAGALAGKHILCEKPLALSLEEADRSIAAADRHHTCLSVNYVLRHNPLNRRLHALLRTGVLGPLHHMSLENLATDEPLKPGHWFWDHKRSGGIWVEHGVHFFDLFGWLSGERARAVAAFARVRADGSHDRVWATVEYSGDLVATHFHAFIRPARLEQTTIRLACTRGSAALYGWIPTRLVVEALLDEEGLETVRAWAGVEPEIVEHYTGRDTEDRAAGGSYRATARLRVELVLAEGKQAVYREAVRASVRDILAGIRDSRHAPEVSARDGRESLAIALATRRAGETGARQTIT